MIKYLLPGTAAANTGVLRSETLRGPTLLLAVLIAISSGWSISAAAVSIALRSTSRSRSRLADGLFVGGRDDFSGEVQPDRTYGCQTIQVMDHRSRHTIRGGIQHPRESECSSNIARKIGS